MKHSPLVATERTEHMPVLNIRLFQDWSRPAAGTAGLSHKPCPHPSSVHSSCNSRRLPDIPFAGRTPEAPNLSYAQASRAWSEGHPPRVRTHNPRRTLLPLSCAAEPQPRAQNTARRGSLSNLGQTQHPPRKLLTVGWLDQQLHSAKCRDRAPSSPLRVGHGPHRHTPTG